VTDPEIMNNSYMENIYNQFNRLDDSANLWCNAFRKTAMETFSDIGLPVKRKGNEKWKYTAISSIVDKKYLLADKSNIDIDTIRNVAPYSEKWTNIIFVNGYYDSRLSDLPENGMILDIGSAMLDNSQADKLKNTIGSIIDYSYEGFAALNSSFLQDGLLIEIDDDLDAIVNVIFYNTGDSLTFNNPRLFIKAKSNSSASIIESYVGGSAHISLTNSVCEIQVGSKANIKHFRMLSETDNTYDVGYSRVKIDDDAIFSSTSFCKGANIGRYDSTVVLDGVQANCNLKGLYFTSGNQHMDNYINIDHTKVNGISNLFYKGILDGKSRAVFGGTVLVRKEAQKTESIQSDKNLILSPYAEVDSKPALFIYADDVKCAHGATAGNIDADSVFYMRSRGIDAATASKLLIYGFADEIINSVNIPELREYLEESFLKSIPDYVFEF
jgi:Fe-S cluster assembly protein SufD